MHEIDMASDVVAPWHEVTCRFVSMATLIVWLGGFTFYGAVVIPTAHQVLGTHLEVGFITQRVTHWLNVGGVLTCLALAWNLWLLKRNGTKGLRPLVITWGVLVATQSALIALHPYLDTFLDPAEHEINHRATFQDWHRIYLNIATLQWCAAIVHLWYVLLRWRVPPVR